MHKGHNRVHDTCHSLLIEMCFPHLLCLSASTTKKDPFPETPPNIWGTPRRLVTGPLVPKKYRERVSASATEKNPFLETPPNIWGQLDAWSQGLWCRRNTESIFYIRNRKGTFPGNTTQHLGTARCLVTGPLVPKKYGERVSTSATEKNPFLETPPNIWGQLDAWSQGLWCRRDTKTISLCI